MNLDSPLMKYRHIERSVQTAAKSYLGGGVEALAEELRRSHGVMANKLNPDMDTNILGFSEGLYVIQATENVEALRKIAYIIGYSITKIQHSNESGCAIEKAIKLIEKAAAILKRINDAQSPDSEYGSLFSRKEKEEIRTVILATMQILSDLLRNIE